MKRSGPLKRKTPLRPEEAPSPAARRVSAEPGLAALGREHDRVGHYSGKAQDKIYFDRRALFLRMNDICQFHKCRKASRDVHHIEGAHRHELPGRGNLDGRLPLPSQLDSRQPYLRPDVRDAGMTRPNDSDVRCYDMNLMLSFLAAVVSNYGIIHLLGGLLILAVVIYIVWLVLGLMKIPPPLNQIVTLILGLIFLVILLNILGFGFW